MTSFKDDVQDLKQSIQLVITAINQISLKLQNGKLIVYMTNLLLYASKYSWTTKLPKNQYKLLLLKLAKL